MAQARIAILGLNKIFSEDFPRPDFESLGEVSVYGLLKSDEVSNCIKDAEIVLSLGVSLRAEHINSARHLKYISSISTGYNHLDIAAAAARGIPVSNVPDFSTLPVAQHSMALILSLASSLCEHSRAVAAGDWLTTQKTAFYEKPLLELAGKSLGVVGFGDIGQAVARLGHAFGMSILAFAPRPKPAPEYTPFAFCGLQDLFAQADIVSMHCPLTPENAGMVNADLLGRMKKSALFINTARGALVNEADLDAALRTGGIAGAGLDVVGTEPMPAANPLRTAPNCLITPHMAGASAESKARLLRGVFANVQSFLQGRPQNVRNGV